MDSPGTLLALATLGVVAGSLAGMLLWRRRALVRRVGSFACHWSSLPASAGTQVPGIAQYATGRLDWWRLASLSPRPVRSWSRDRLQLVERVDLAEVDPRGRPMVRLTCRHDHEEFALTMSSSAHVGLVFWLEAGPRRARAL